MIALVGHTGFVGSNLFLSAKDEIDLVYNSINIEEAYGTNPDLLIYAGVRAEKYLANAAPMKDLNNIIQAEENIKRINPRKLVLISSVDVFGLPQNVDETSMIETKDLHAYGLNRYKLELWVRENYPDALIVRLPSLFGKNIKKNFIYDYINIIPFMLSVDKFDELSEKDGELKDYYCQDNGFYKVKSVSYEEKEVLKEKFFRLNFTALNFTDSRSRFQFYNLSRLWKDIQLAIEHEITLWHSATEPVSAEELYEFLSGKEFKNILRGVPKNYNYKTIHYKIYNGNRGYICSKSDILNEIKEFVRMEQCKI